MKKKKKKKCYIIFIYVQNIQLMTHPMITMLMIDAGSKKTA